MPALPQHVAHAPDAHHERAGPVPTLREEAAEMTDAMLLWAAWILFFAWRILRAAVRG
jgi:hypothetical protein